MLHIVNGECAVSAVKKAGFHGDFLAWDDLLYEGPVPIPELDKLSGIRARFVSDAGWEGHAEALRRFRRRDRSLERYGGGGEILLWNSFELTDQLHLLQLLHWFSQQKTRSAGLRIIFVDDYLTEDALPLIQNCWGRQQDATDAQLAAAASLWIAFCSKSPLALERLSHSADIHHELPFINQSLLRLFQEYPGVGDGLSRTQRQILGAVEKGPLSPVEIFAFSQSKEYRRFMGDWSFWRVLEGLALAPQPLLVPPAGTWIPFEPLHIGSHAAFCDQRLEITAEGLNVLAGRADALDLNDIDRWIGGVHLVPGKVWRWCEEGGRFFGGAR